MSTQSASIQTNEQRKQIREFVESVIKIRKALLRSDQNKKNVMLMHEIIDRLERFLNAYPYNSARNLAKFFLLNAQEILEILPGEGSKCHDCKYDEFNKIYESCLHLIKENP